MEIELTLACPWCGDDMTATDAGLDAGVRCAECGVVSVLAPDPGGVPWPAERALPAAA
jgi:uncharacterized Zn finger protein